MATENGMPEQQERELRLNRDLGELILAVENLDTIDLREWMAEAGYLLPTETKELQQQLRNTQQDLLLYQAGAMRPPQTS